MLPIHLKTNLIMFPFYPDATINDLQMLGRDPKGSFFMMIVSRRGVEVHPWASLSGHSLIPDCIGETFHSSIIPISVGTGWEQSSSWTAAGKWDHPCGSFSKQWGGSGSLDMVTTFCHHDQAKVESLEAISNLCQWDPPKPSVVVVKIFANSPYLP